MHYKGIFLIAFIVIAFSSTSSAQYLVKAFNGKTLPAPRGMSYIPGGSITLKYGDDDSDSSNYDKISLSSFYIDKTEISNKQYREFIDWVIDSVAVITCLKDDAGYFRKDRRDSTKRIDWKKARDVFKSHSRDLQSKLAPMYAHDEIRKDLYVYTFQYLKAGSLDRNKNNYVTESINVYPATKVWDTDFPNSQSDMMVNEYFTNPAYDNYPVVGVTWQQAVAYTYWRTMMANSKKKDKYLRNYHLSYSLPSEAQWVYAAQGQQMEGMNDSEIVPRDKNNNLLANFKQSEGDYSEDGASYTVPVMSYAPNQFGLYNMYGNVAEWILDAYNESSWAFVNDQNPVLLYDANDSEPGYMKRKVVRGGSWKDNGSSLSPYTRDYEMQDVPHSYIGFRCVMAAPEIIGRKVQTRRKKIRKEKNIASK